MATIRKRHWTNSKGERKIAFECSYKDTSGKRRRKQFRLKKDADSFLVRVRAQVADGIHIADSDSITIAEAAELWLRKSEAQGLEMSTLVQYNSFVKLHLLPYIAHVKLSRLSTPVVQDYINRVLENNSRHRAKVCRSHLFSIVSHVQLLGLIAHNPVTPVKIRDNKRQKKRTEIPSKEELRTLLRNASNRFYPILVMAVFTGMRSSEILGLTWDNVDLEEGLITVCQRAERVSCRLGPPKSKAGYRTIPMAPIVKSTLKTWEMYCPRSDWNLVFPNHRGGIMHHSNLVAYEWKPLQMKHGMLNENGQRHRYKFHSLRHAAASMFIEQGFNMKQLQVVVGHENISMTIGTYGHLFEDAKPSLEMMAKVEEGLIKLTSSAANVSTQSSPESVKQEEKSEVEYTSDTLTTES